MEFFTNPWVIGIGTGVIVGLILRFVFGVGKPKSKHSQIATATQEKNHSTPPPIPAQGATSDITPTNIKEYLDSLPPLQRDLAAENYKGIKVSWKVHLSSASTLFDRKLHLYMYFSGQFPHKIVTCTVEDPQQYPILRVIKETQVFTVEGEIEEVKDTAIKLKNARFFF